MKLPAAFVIFGLLMVALSAFADEDSNDLTADEESALQNTPEGIYRRPGILDNWEANAHIFYADDIEKSDD